MNIPIPALVDTAAKLVENFAFEIEWSRCSPRTAYYGSRTRGIILGIKDYPILPFLIPHLELLRDSTYPQADDLRVAWTMLLKDMASYSNSKTPHDQCTFSCWVEWAKNYSHTI